MREKVIDSELNALTTRDGIEPSTRAVNWPAEGTTGNIRKYLIGRGKCSSWCLCLFSAQGRVNKHAIKFVLLLTDHISIGSYFSIELYRISQNCHFRELSSERIWNINFLCKILTNKWRIYRKQSRSFCLKRNRNWCCNIFLLRQFRWESEDKMSFRRDRISFVERRQKLRTLEHFCHKPNVHSQGSCWRQSQEIAFSSQF